MNHSTREQHKIVHVSSAHPWTDNRVHYRECATLSSAGYDVALIAVEATVQAPVGDVDVVRIPRRSRLKRFLVSAPQVIGIAIRSRASVVHLHDPELAWAVPVLRVLRRKVIFDAHEDLPVDVLNKPYIKRWARPFLLTFAHLMVWMGARANRVVAATETIALRFPSSKTVVIHNYPPLLSGEVAEDVADRDDTAVYIGAMSAIRGTPELLDAVRDSHFPARWKLVIAGTATPEVADIVRDAQTRSGIVYHTQLPPDEARRLLTRAKVGIVPFQDTPAHREALPTKMFEYFAAGLPVIATDFPLWRTIVQENQCGILVDSSSAGDIAEAIARYANDIELWRLHSKNARRLAVTELNWGPEGERLVEMYRDLVG